MNLWPGVYRIESDFNGNLLCMVVLRGLEKTVLIDTGLPETPERAIFPYLRAINLDPASLDSVVITHASADHFGGVAAIRQAAPKVRVMAHRRDVGSISSLAHHLDENFTRAADLGYPWSEAAFTVTRALFGPPQAVDWAVEGGEMLDLGGGWVVTLLHTPGHTPGHLSVWDARHGAVYLGDALLGRGVVALDGRLASPPPYFSVEDYLGSVATIRALQPRALIATHYPIMSGDAVTAFLDASEAFVRQCDTALAELLTTRRSLTFAEAVNGLEACIGPSGEVWRLTASAHLDALVDSGRAAYVETSTGSRWTPIQETGSAS